MVDGVVGVPTPVALVRVAQQACNTETVSVTDQRGDMVEKVVLDRIDCLGDATHMRVPVSIVSYVVKIVST